MIRGTTPTVRINVNSNLDLSQITKLWITFELDGYERTFTLEEVEVDATNKKILIPMSQADTLAFSAGTANVQMRCKLAGDDATALASNIKRINIDKILKDGVI